MSGYPIPVSWPLSKSSNRSVLWITSSGPWRLPAPNPFLTSETPAPNAGLIRGQTSAHRGLRTFAQDRSRSRRERSPMQFSQALPDNGVDGAIVSTLAPGINTRQTGFKRGWKISLHALREDARQAGVDCSFSASGNEWLLKMTGLAGADAQGRWSTR